MWNLWKKKQEPKEQEPKGHSPTAAAAVDAGVVQAAADGTAAAAPAGQAAEESREAQARALDALIAQGRHAEAASAAEAMTRRYPADAVLWKVLGALRGQLGNAPQALDALQRAVAFAPADAESHANLGAALIMLRRAPEAEASLRRALQLAPDPSTAHNLGLVLKDTGRFAQAEESFRSVLTARPGDPGALYQLSATLYLQGRLRDAEASYRQLLHYHPGHLAAYTDLCMVLGELGRMDEVVALCQQALRIDPSFAYTHANLSSAYKSLNRLEEAEASGRRALAIRPDFAEAHSNLGTVLQDLGRLAEAEQSYRRALAIKPDYEPAQRNLLFCLNYLERPAAECLAEARRYGQMVSTAARAPFATWRCAPAPQRLRVGLVSGDLCHHPVGYFLEAWLANLAPEVVELHAYVSGPTEDDVTARLKPRFAAWTSLLAMNDEAAARRIHDDGVHILIDLAGHTAHNRLPVFAWKPAPVQVTWLGYFATTGVAQIDYLIADPWTLPATQEQYFTEHVWRLPRTRLCFTAPDAPVTVSALPALARGQVTFGCFNHLTKVTDAVVALWAQVLLAVPASRLMLRAKQLAQASVREETVRRFAAQGIGAERLVMDGPVSRPEYLAAYQSVDIALDPFPYTGGATTAEALWMGVPVLTLAGEHFLSRQGVGLLTNAGLPEWVATSPDDYVARARRHAADIPALAALRARLRAQVLVSPLFDGAAFAQAMQEALLAMWQEKAGAAVLRVDPPAASASPGVAGA